MASEPTKNASESIEPAAEVASTPITDSAPDPTEAAADFAVAAIPEDVGFSQADADALLAGVEAAIQNAAEQNSFESTEQAVVAAANDGAQPFTGPDFTADELDSDVAAVSALDDVELDVRIELGRTEMYVEDVLKLRPGAVVQLDRLAGDPVDVYINNRLVARGEVLVLNDNFCVRVSDILAIDEDSDESAA